MGSVKVLAGALLIVSSVVSAARGDYCPPQSRQSDGMRDIMLIYATPGHWQPKNFLPYVAYVDREGKPRDWFYDAYLFLMYGGAPSGQTYIDGATNRKDWEFYLDEEFAPGREFAALEQTIADAARQMAVKPPTGLVKVPDENRLTTAANLCRRLGMGVEMELNMGIDMVANKAAFVDTRDRINLQLYLDHGDDALDGYRDGAVRAYYQGYNAIAGLSASGDVVTVPFGGRLRGRKERRLGDVVIGAGGHGRRRSRSAARD